MITSPYPCFCLLACTLTSLPKRREKEMNVRCQMSIRGQSQWRWGRWKSIHGKEQQRWGGIGAFFSFLISAQWLSSTHVLWNPVWNSHPSEEKMRAAMILSLCLHLSPCSLLPQLPPLDNIRRTKRPQTIDDYDLSEAAMLRRFQERLHSSGSIKFSESILTSMSQDSYRCWWQMLWIEL